MSKNKGHRFASREAWLKVRATTKRWPTVLWQSTSPYRTKGEGCTYVRAKHGELK